MSLSSTTTAEAGDAEPDSPPADGELGTGQPPGLSVRSSLRAWVSRHLFIVLPPILWAVLGWHRRWITDDGLIAARTVRQLLAGNGPVFNVGERVEANTSTLWTYLLALIAWITGLNVYTVMIWTGIVLAPVGLLLALLGARRLHERTAPGRLMLPVGALVVLALPPFWDFVTSGLEDSLVFSWLGLNWWLLTGLQRESSAEDADQRSARRPMVFAFVAGLGWLVRPDMALGTLFLLAAGWYVVRPAWPRAVRLLVVAGALPVAYQIFRMGYYGQLTPNTAVAKDASSTHVPQGWTYLVNFVSPYRLWIPLLLLLALALLLVGRRLSRADAAMCVGAAGSGVVMAGYVVAIGGDFMHARMLLPATFALLLPVMVLPVPRPTRRVLIPKHGLGTLAAAAACVLAITAWAVVCGTSWRLPQRPGVVPAGGIDDERAFWSAYIHQRNPETPTEYVDAIMGTAQATGSFEWMITQALSSDEPPVLFYTVDGTHIYTVPLDRSGYSVAVTAVLLGTSGASVPLNGLVVDEHGLSYVVGSHVIGVPDGRPGHDKYVGPAWIIAEYSDASSAPGVPAAQIAAARKALSCGGLAQLDQATQAPLTFARFWSNVVHAPSLTSLRFSSDPIQAEHTLCD